MALTIDSWKHDPVMPGGIIVSGTNAPMHLTLAWLTGPGRCEAAFTMTNAAGHWEVRFGAIIPGHYSVIANCANDGESAGPFGIHVELFSALTPLAPAPPPPPPRTLADYYPRHVGTFGGGPAIPNPLVFAGFVMPAGPPELVTVLLSFIPDDLDPTKFKFGVAVPNGNHWHHVFGPVAAGPAKLRRHFMDGTSLLDLPITVG